MSEPALEAPRPEVVVDRVDTDPAPPKPAEPEPAVPIDSLATNLLGEIAALRPGKNDDALRLATMFVERAAWPGGVVSFFGAVIISTLIFSQEVHTSFTPSEFIAALIVGAVITLAGPAIIAQSTAAGRKSSADFRRTTEVQATAISNTARLAEAQAQLEYQKILQSGNAVPRRDT
jgi:hypothetical protein